MATAALTGLLVASTAIPALALENESGSISCSTYGVTVANGAGIMYVKAPGGSYQEMPYDPDFRVEQRTVLSDGAWGASAELLLESVTYATCK